jgi:AraC-like DNA-binding protein
MLDLAEEVTGKRKLPGFSSNVIFDEELTCYLQPLHELVMSGSSEFEKEEYLLMMLSLLIEKYGQPFERYIPECREEIQKACVFLQEHYTERIDLDQICRCASLSKTTLIRAFTRSKGVTPYRYLENIRINEAKKLLEQGISPVDVALQTGFSDQSHFTNFFHMFLGLALGIYRDIFMENTGGGGKNDGKE